MKKYLLLFLIIISCANLDKEYVCVDDYFSLQITGNLTKTQQKQMSNIILNESGIKYNKNADKKIILNANFSEAGSMLSADNTASLVNIFLNANVSIKADNKNIYTSFIKIIATTNFDSQKRYVALINRNYAHDNLYEQMGKELKSRIDILLNSCLKN
ncbi:MAG: hypothetical protein Ta2D_08200 [Rickettsiales bacterium]|nr:MAG: hypothetical protein Ta2D_08200 [Rickettsiales bacterium]